MISNLKKLTPKFVKRKIQNIELFRKFKYIISFHYQIYPKIKKQLKLNDDKHFFSKNKNPRKIFIPLIETSHYQYLQILILAKALQIRGAKVKLLVCNQELSGCEIKSVLNNDLKDPCFTCRFNSKWVLPLFGIDTINITDLLNSDEIDKIDKYSKEINLKKNYLLIRHGIDLSICIEDSVVRYFYGSVPKDEKIVRNVRVAHVKTAIMMSECALKIDELWKPDIILSNMPSYSAWEPFYKYYDLVFLNPS